MQAAFASIAAHEEVLARRLLDYLATTSRVSIVGEATADQAVRVPTISFTVQGLAAPDIVRQIDPLRIGIRYGDFHSRRLVEHLGLQAAGGVVLGPELTTDLRWITYQNIPANGSSMAIVTQNAPQPENRKSSM